MEEFNSFLESLMSGEYPETIYDDMRNHVSGIVSAADQTTADKDREIAGLRQEIEELRARALDSVMDSGVGDEGDDGDGDIDPETITIDDLFD